MYQSLIGMEHEWNEKIYCYVDVGYQSLIGMEHNYCEEHEMHGV